MVVKSELQKHGLHFTTIQLGEVEVMETISKELYDTLDAGLKKQVWN